MIQSKVCYLLFLLCVLALHLVNCGTAEKDNTKDWLPTRSNNLIPTNAVYGGYNHDGSPIYVGRAVHETNILTAKIWSKRRLAYIAYNGKEYEKQQFDILIGTGYTWTDVVMCQVGKNAVSVGTNENSEKVFVCRAHFHGGLHVGHFVQSKRQCEIPWGGRVFVPAQFQVLYA